MAVNFPSIAWIPVAIVLVLIFAFWMTEATFQLNATMKLPVSAQIEKIDCGFKITDNGTDRSLCRENYGFLGWKVWTTDEEEKLIEGSMLKIINPSPQKIIIVPADSKFNYNLNE